MALRGERCGVGLWKCTHFIASVPCASKLLLLSVVLCCGHTCTRAHTTHAHTHTHTATTNNNKQQQTTTNNNNNNAAQHKTTHDLTTHETTMSDTTPRVCVCACVCTCVSVLCCVVFCVVLCCVVPPDHSAVNNHPQRKGTLWPKNYLVFNSNSRVEDISFGSQLFPRSDRMNRRYSAKLTPPHFLA